MKKMLVTILKQQNTIIRTQFHNEVDKIIQKVNSRHKGWTEKLFDIQNIHDCQLSQVGSVG